MDPIILSLIIIFIVLIIAVFIFTFIIYRIAFYNDKKSLSYKENPLFDEFEAFLDAIYERANELSKIPYEDIYIKSYDGLTLHGRFYKGEDDKNIHIHLHGYKGEAYRDTSSGVLSSIKDGNNTLMVDLRGHGLSGSKTVTFGLKDRYDLREWARYMDERFNHKNNIFLMGISMGGATVLMASNLDLPKSVKGIISDCPYSSVKDIILNTVRNMGLNGKLVYPFILLTCRLYLGISLNDSSAVESVKETKLPILIIHGTSDTYVPYKMSEKIKEANENIELVSIKGTMHGLSFFVDPKTYLDKVHEFTQKYSE